MQTPNLSDMSRREIEDYLVERALVDSTFRESLLTEPEALLRDLGIRVGPNTKIRVLEEEPHSFYLVLPRVLHQQGELDDEALDKVAGGSGEGNDPNTGTGSVGADGFFGY